MADEIVEPGSRRDTVISLSGKKSIFLFLHIFIVLILGSGPRSVLAGNMLPVIPKPY